MSLDGFYYSKQNRKLIFNSGMKQIYQRIKETVKNQNLGQPDILVKQFCQERFQTIERVFVWEDKFKRALIRFERISEHYFGVKLLAYSLINLRHFITE